MSQGGLDQRFEEQFSGVPPRSLHELVTNTIKAGVALGFAAAHFELLDAYDLGRNDISLARQVAINGKRVCLLVPGAMRDGRL